MYLDVEASAPQVENCPRLRKTGYRYTFSTFRFHDKAKRLTDILVSLFALIVLSPFLILVAVLIRLESPGPALFSQNRWGRGGKIIRIYKFRSMYSELCDHSGVAQTVEADPRITPIGRWLRRTNIDELPQLLNVLRGDMSLVGPRCHAIGMLAGGMVYEELVPEYHLRHRVRPGMTGLAQVRGWRGSTNSPAEARARIAADLYYIDHMSWSLDMKIMLATIVNEARCASGS
jgi:lipopolysaccharide/colanic/teichoic acid biosynthesis glycosyltransferase